MNEHTQIDAVDAGMASTTGVQAVAWYAEAMERLVGVVQALSQARDVPAKSRFAM